MKTREDNRKEIKNALSCFIGKLIHFKDKNFDENIDNAGSIFRGTHVTDNDEGILLWDNEYRYVTLQYALENSIKDCSKNEPNNPYNDIIKEIIKYAENPKFSEDSESQDYLSDGQMLDLVIDKLKNLSDTNKAINFNLKTHYANIIDADDCIRAIDDAVNGETKPPTT